MIMWLKFYNQHDFARFHLPRGGSIENSIVPGFGKVRIIPVVAERNIITTIRNWN